MITYIYTLQDPITHEIRYVGKTNNLKPRLYSHIKECNTDRKTHKINWIKSLLNKGLKPVISILDEVPIDEWEFWERYWIQQLVQWEIKLTNISSGGSKGNDYKRTAETRERMRKSKIGKELSTEHKENISKSIKERLKKDPYYNRGKGNSRIYLNKEELYQKYIIDNLSIPKCAIYFNVSEKLVFTNLKEYDIQKDKSIWTKQMANDKKIVIQYSLNGGFIKKWSGLCDIESELDIRSTDISACCNGRTNISHGYIWRFEADDIDRVVNNSKYKKPIAKFDTNGKVCFYFRSF